MRFAVWSCVFIVAGWFASPAVARPLELPRADGIRVRVIETHGLGKSPVAPILAHLGLRPGAPLDARQIRRGRAALLARGDLIGLEIRPLLAGPDSLIVIVGVQRAPSFVVSPRGGRTPDGRLAAGGHLLVRGSSGRGEQLNVEVVQGGESRLGLAWEEPRPSQAFGVGFRLSGQAARTPEPAESGAVFERTEARLALLLRRGVTRFELEGTLAEERADIGTTRIDTASDRDRFRGLGLRWRGRDRAANFTWREAAFDVALHVWDGSAAWRRASGACGVRLPLGGRSVVAVDTAWQLASGVVPRSHRQHLGNARAPRVLPYAAASGDAAWTAALGFQIPLNFRDADGFRRAPLPLALQCFVDGGMAWGATAPGARTSALQATAARWRWSAGAGGTVWLRGSLPCRLEVGFDDHGDVRCVGGIGLDFD